MFDKTELEKNLSALSPKQLLAFAASCCERILPMYEAFVLTERWGNWELIRNIINQIWDFLITDSIFTEDITKLIKQCNKITPDSQRFTSFFTEASQFAIGAVKVTLECYRNGDMKDAAAAANFVVEAIYDYISSVNVVFDPIVKFNYLNINNGSSTIYSSIKSTQNDDISDEWIFNSPLMLAETKKQGLDIVALKTLSLNAEFYKELRQSSQITGILPIKRKLIYIKK